MLSVIRVRASSSLGTRGSVDCDPLMHARRLMLAHTQQWSGRRQPRLRRVHRSDRVRGRARRRVRGMPCQHGAQRRPHGMCRM